MSETTALERACKKCSIIFSGKYCKACKKLYAQCNKEKILAYKKQWDVENQDRMKLYYAAYFSENFDRISKRNAEHYANNEGRDRAIAAALRPIRMRKPRKKVVRLREKKVRLKVIRVPSDEVLASRREIARLSAKKWRAENPERSSELAAKYRKNNPEKIRVNNRNRKALQRGATGRISPGRAQVLMRLQKSMCACCRCDLKKSGFHMDHIDPLAKGGSNSDDNIQLLCPTCNMEKHDKLPHDFMRSRGFLI
ncbi:HNH endonuclease signature motif containing protein [Massilia sp. DWR3-1-1]|uniref:HNH endonuclease signature motif containing protein n=1 Tax=Massilia sp. DWR3-1-1 TaxID=2804559 RepID=UPI003CF3A95B